MVTVRVETPTIGTENVILGRTERTTEREPLRGDDAVTEGTIRIGDGTGSRPGSGVALAGGLALALGSGVGLGGADDDGDAPGDAAGGVPLATSSTAAPTWSRPYPESGLWPPAANGLALWVRLASASSGVRPGRNDRRRATVPVTCGVAIEVPDP